MKFKTTKKEIKNNYHLIISLGYCGAQHLLKYVEPIAYSTRVEGWACDYYDIDGVLISTGYAPLKDNNTKSTYEIISKYDNQARVIINDYSLDYEQRQDKVNELLKQYIKEVTK